MKSFLLISLEFLLPSLGFYNKNECGVITVIGMNTKNRKGVPKRVPIEFLRPLCDSMGTWVRSWYSSQQLLNATFWAYKGGWVESKAGEIRMSGLKLNTKIAIGVLFFLLLYLN